MANIWVFGYGSLMWDNEQYNPKRIEKATLQDWHRSYNKKSVVSRGTKDDPGLVLGLEKGGQCKGVAILIDEDLYLDAIRIREKGQQRKAYIEIKNEKIVSDTGQELTNCHVYIPNPESINHIPEGSLTLTQKAKIAIKSKPPKGKGKPIDYVLNNHTTALQLGIDDPCLREMHDEVKRLLSQSVDPNPAPAPVIEHIKPGKERIELIKKLFDKKYSEKGAGKTFWVYVECEDKKGKKHISKNYIRIKDESQYKDVLIIPKKNPILIKDPQKMRQYGPFGPGILGNKIPVFKMGKQMFLPGKGNNNPDLELLRKELDFTLIKPKGKFSLAWVCYIMKEKDSEGNSNVIMNPDAFNLRIVRSFKKGTVKYDGTKKQFGYHYDAFTTGESEAGPDKGYKIMFDPYMDIPTPDAKYAGPRAEPGEYKLVIEIAKRPKGLRGLLVNSKKIHELETISVNHIKFKIEPGDEQEV